MKKLLAILLVLSIVFAFGACAGKSGTETPTDAPKPANTATGKVYYLNFKPEADQAWQDLAKTYTEQTGVEVKVVTAASGEYDNTLAAEMDKGENASKLISFKEKIKSSSITCDFFESTSDLETKVLQSVTKELNRQNKRLSTSSGNTQSYIEGAKLFARFVHTPAMYKNREAILKVRFDGLFGSYMLNDDLPRAFGFQPGAVLFLNDLFVLGKEPDVLAKHWSMDCFCESEAIDWVEDNEISPGTIFTGRFRFAYEQGKGIGRRTENGPAIDTYIAELILIEGIEINSRNVPTAPRNISLEEMLSLRD